MAVIANMIKNITIKATAIAVEIVTPSATITHIIMAVINDAAASPIILDIGRSFNGLKNVSNPKIIKKIEVK